MLAGDGRQSSPTTSSDDDLSLPGPHAERWGSAPMIRLPSSTTHQRPPRIDVRNSSYTSLKDLVVSSPTYYMPDGGVTFRNSLLKHAAYAYLQPRESPSSFANRVSCFGERWPEDEPLTGCVGWVVDVCSCVYDICSHAFSSLFSQTQKGWMRDGAHTSGRDRSEILDP